MSDQIKAKEIHTRRLPSAAVLSEWLRVDPETGLLFWRARAVPANADEDTAVKIDRWNMRNAGKTAFKTQHSQGYKTGTIERRHMYAHRVIWKIMTDQEPRQIDHINGDRADNRWANLREVSLAENRKNMGRRSNNKSGVSGVHFSKKDQRWIAQIRNGGRTQHLGSFLTKEAAARIRKIAEERRGFHPNHGKREGWSA